MNSDHFALLLARLDPDSDRAGETYERLRLRLITFFQFRKCHLPEECADETLDRVARKLAEGESVENLFAYAHGVAKYVLLEYRRRPDRETDEIDPTLPSRTDILDEAMRSENLACFKQCLQELAPEDARLLLQYWVHDEKTNIRPRQELAAELGISAGALRLRIMRIRTRFIACFEKCAGPRQKG